MPSNSKITPNEVDGKLGFDDRQPAGGMTIADDQPIDFVTLGMFIIGRYFPPLHIAYMVTCHSARCLLVTSLSGMVVLNN